MASNRPRRRKQEQEAQEAPKKGRLNNMEMLAIGLFCLAIMLYGASRCGDEPEPTTNPTVTEEVVDSNALANNNINEANNPPPPPPRQVDTSSFKNKLYTTIDSLRLRKDPQIGGELVGYLKYGEEVVDLGERTAQEKIRVTVDEIRTAPWVKVKTADGKEGWAFGAYFQFYPLVIQTDMPEVNNEESSHQE